MPTARHCFAGCDKTSSSRRTTDAHPLSKHGRRIRRERAIHSTPFPEPMDQALAEDMIALRDAAGARVAMTAHTA